MEARNYYNTPLDRVDDEMLSRLLAEEDCLAGNCGDFMRNHTVNAPNQVNMRRSANVRRRTADRSEMHYSNIGRESSCNCPCSNMQSRQESAPESPCPNEKCMVNSSLSGYPLAMVYSPDQEWHKLYDIEEALGMGTLFCELNFPFYPACGCKSE